MTTREELIELINKLFIYTDYRKWDNLQNEVFSDTVFLDMTSLGGSASEMSAYDICAQWEAGFAELDAVDHLSGNYLVKVHSETEAEVFAYATAKHYKAAAKNGQIRTFVGSYDFKLHKDQRGWRIYHFFYDLKFVSGNTTLE